MVTPHFYLKKLDLSVADYSLLYALGTRQKSYGPILNLPILTDTDSNRFLGILTLPIPITIFIHKYQPDTDMPIPIIPIPVGTIFSTLPLMYLSVCGCIS